MEFSCEAILGNTSRREGGKEGSEMGKGQSLKVYYQANYIVHVGV